MQLTISTHDDKVITIEVYGDHFGYIRHANASCLPEAQYCRSRCLFLGCCIQVDADTDVSTLQAILEAETGLSVEQQHILHNGRLLPTRFEKRFQHAGVTALLGFFSGTLCAVLCSGTLQAAQVQTNNLLMLSSKQQVHAQPQQQQMQQQQQRQAPPLLNSDGSLQNPQAFLSAWLSNPVGLSALRPALRDAVSSGDVNRIQEVFRQEHREREQQQKEAQLIRPGEDPMDPEVQVLHQVFAIFDGILCCCHFCALPGCICLVAFPSNQASCTLRVQLSVLLCLAHRAATM